MNNHTKNIFTELDKQIELDIDKKATKLTSKLMDEMFTQNTTQEMITFLKEAYYNIIKSTEADKWFKNKAHCMDLEMHQGEIEKLEQTIENMKMKIT